MYPRYYCMKHLFVSTLLFCSLFIIAGKRSVCKSQCFVPQNEQKSLGFERKLLTVVFLLDECLSRNAVSFSQGLRDI